MKKLILVFCILSLAACKSKKHVTEVKPKEPKVTKVIPEKVDQAQKDKAYELGRRVLMACNTSKFKPFTAEEATPAVIKNATPDRLTKTCHNFQLKYGDFKGVRFVEVVRDKKNKLNIYRFKADYEKKIANKELRVSMNEKNQVSAIKSLDWVDTYK
ncbi:MAG: hypothetical protein EOO48_02555 [Flavobacterium sp.]|nr:MAG: hypothetical protein EOO48_02555 [Flavobacterium sp.]